MQINLYIATLKVGDCKGISTITAYDSNQAMEIADDFWNGYKDYNGEISVNQISGITCECGVSTSLKALCGNSLSEVLNMKEDSKDKDTYILGDYIFDVVRQTLTHKDNEVEGLTTKESELLLMLVSMPNKLIERDTILEKIWLESNYYNSRSMDVYITKLRKHFIKDARIELINVHGKGFKLVLPN